LDVIGLFPESLGRDGMPDALPASWYELGLYGKRLAVAS